jgi:hypothetical protein
METRTRSYEVGMVTRRGTAMGVADRFVAITLIMTLAAWAAPPASWAGTLTSIYTLSANKSDGCYPTGTLLRDGSGALFGTTEHCPITMNDTVFKLTPPPAGQTTWSFSVLHTFAGSDEGDAANPNLVMDRNGALYGTAYDYGHYIQGAVFRLSPPAPGQTQ